MSLLTLLHESPFDARIPLPPIQTQNMKHVRGGLVWPWFSVANAPPATLEPSIYSTCPHVCRPLSSHMPHVMPVQIQEIPSLQGKRTRDLLVNFPINASLIHLIQVFFVIHIRPAFLLLSYREQLATRLVPLMPLGHILLPCASLLPTDPVRRLNVPCRSLSVVGIFPWYQVQYFLQPLSPQRPVSFALCSCLPSLLSL